MHSWELGKALDTSSGEEDQNWLKPEVTQRAKANQRARAAKTKLKQKELPERERVLSQQI